MRIEFTIGGTEPHQMQFSFDQTFGDLIIVMDGVQVLQDSAKLAREAVKSYELSVGDCEKHRLAFQLMYGDGLDDTGLEPISKTRLAVTAIA